MLSRQENHPAVNIKWAEADATKMALKEAANRRGMGKGQGDRWQFPWGNEFDKAKANTAASDSARGEGRVIKRRQRHISIVALFWEALTKV